MISVLELDTLYNIIALHKIGGFTDSNAVYQSVGIVALPNRYVVGGFIYDSSSPNYWRTRLYKVDKSFTVLDSNDFNSLFSMQSNFAFSNKIVATTDRLSTPCVLDWHIQKLEIDSNLNIVSCALMNSLLSYTCYNSGTTFNNTAALYQQGKAIALSSTKCLVMGVSTEQCRVAVPYSYDVVVNAILNSNSQTIKTNVLANSFTNTNYPGDWNTPYSIRLPYFVTVSAIGFTNSPSYQPPFFPYYFQQRSKLLVNKTDTMGNIIWSKYFGGEMNYFGRTIAFTSDGGCIIAGTRYDSTTMFLPHISQNFLLKLDAEGNYTSVGIIENGKMKENSVKCYPNPSNQVIYFDIPFESEIEINLYNNLGELVLKKTEYNNMSEIDISQLTQALYNYKIHTKLNFYSGKFLKE
ncbi:MAG: T9SS type A sorting domain-containing protein [bacterium]|nr:T9SS type A sorting domain-containing protein [bacterium]